MANISNGSIKSINSILMSLFGESGNAYCTDGGDMTMTYHFDFELTPVQAAIVGQSNVLPKPVGVASSIVQT
jgi:5,10-methylene-tetrahydrofolate dehydrogenase/methenyl tetrahydrofolate cyclohydrolase